MTNLQLTQGGEPVDLAEVRGMTYYLIEFNGVGVPLLIESGEITGHDDATVTHQPHGGDVRTSLHAYFGLSTISSNRFTFSTLKGLAGWRDERPVDQQATHRVPKTD